MIFRFIQQEGLLRIVKLRKEGGVSVLTVTIGKKCLEAENIIGIWGDIESGKSYVLSKTVFQLLSGGQKERKCLHLDERMAAYFGKGMKEYLKNITSLADEKFSPVLVIDNLETIKEKYAEFYNILKERINNGVWDLIYASNEMITDFKVDKNIILYTFREQNLYLVNIVSPPVNGIEDLTVTGFEGRN